MDTRAGRHSWLRWLARSFLLMSVLVTIFWILWQRSWNDGWASVLGFDIILLGLPILIVIIIIAWLQPISGGVASIMAGPLLFFWIVPNSLAETLSRGNLPYLLECGLLVIGGILSIVWGWLNGVQRMADIANTGSSGHRWFRWLPRIIFLTAVFTPIFFELGAKFPNLDYVARVYGVPILFIITIIAWIAPISGGALAIIAVPVLFWLQLMYSSAAHAPAPSSYLLLLFFECFLLVTGGILSIIWGVQRRRWRHNQEQITTTTGSR